MLDIVYSYLAGCCPISDFIGSPLPNKSDIGQAADQTTVLLFPPRISVFANNTIQLFQEPHLCPSCIKKFQFTYIPLAFD